MRLRNKKTGQEGNFIINKGHFECVDLEYVPEYRNLAELNEEWQDYEEPKEVWYIDFQGVVRSASKEENDWFKESEIGNCFETKEEAEQAVEKLKALKRLKDNGFKFEGIKQDYTRFFSQQKPIRIGRKYLQFNKAEDEEWLKENWEDLDLLFGGEE